MQNTFLEEIYKSRQNVLKRMEYNGYENIDDYSNFSMNEVSTMIQNNQLDMLLYKNKNQNQTDKHTSMKTKLITLSFLLLVFMVNAQTKDTIAAIKNKDKISCKQFRFEWYRNKTFMGNNILQFTCKRRTQEETG